MYEYFLIIPPGLEDLALQEVELKCPVSKVEIHKGGLSVSADLDWVIEAHLFLKIPTRILLRITEFKVKDLPKLYQKFLSLKLTSYISHPEPIWHVSAAKSRLIHTGRIEETLKDALTEHFRRSPLSLDYQKKNFDPQNIYVRLDNDLCTISLDLSGEPLYKRGLQTIKGEAPIRENFAAAMLFELFMDETEEVTLLDPTCGSGTLLTEAYTFYHPLHLRKFALEEIPLFKGKTIKKRTSEKHFPIKEYVGSDLNKELIEKISHPSINFMSEDALTFNFKRENLYMIANPPYGERIKIEGKRGMFLKDLWIKVLTFDQPLRFAMVLPSDFDDLFKNPPAPYKTTHQRKFRNGGIMVTYWIWGLQE